MGPMASMCCGICREQKEEGCMTSARPLHESGAQNERVVKACQAAGVNSLYLELDPVLGNMCAAYVLCHKPSDSHRRWGCAVLSRQQAMHAKCIIAGAKSPCGITRLCRPGSHGSQHVLFTARCAEPTQAWTAIFLCASLAHWMGCSKNAVIMSWNLWKLPLQFVGLCV